MPRAETTANQVAANKQFNETAPRGIRYAVDAGAQVINISLGTPEGSPQLTAAVKYALERGSLIFAAVGNKGDKGNPVQYPAATPGVVGVGAVGKNLRRTAESEYGPQVDMAAPGDDMVEACGTETGLCRSHGTSDATALASASAALIWSEHPTWTNNQVLRVMLNTIGGPTDGAKRNDSIGYGIVRPRIALQNPGDPGPADAYPLPDFPAAASKPPSPEASESASTSTPAKDDNSTATASASKGSSTRWIALGIGAVVLLAAGVVATVSRRRRTITPPLPKPATDSSQFPYSPTGFPPLPHSAPGTREAPTYDREPGST